MHALLVKVMEQIRQQNNVVTFPELYSERIAWQQSVAISYARRLRMRFGNL